MKTEDRGQRTEGGGSAYRAPLGKRAGRDRGASKSARIAQEGRLSAVRSLHTFARLRRKLLPAKLSEEASPSAGPILKRNSAGAPPLLGRLPASQLERRKQASAALGLQPAPHRDVESFRAFPSVQQALKLLLLRITRRGFGSGVFRRLCLVFVNGAPADSQKLGIASLARDEKAGSRFRQGSQSFPVTHAPIVAQPIPAPQSFSCFPAFEIPPPGFIAPLYP